MKIKRNKIEIKATINEMLQHNKHVFVYSNGGERSYRLGPTESKYSGDDKVELREDGIFIISEIGGYFRSKEVLAMERKTCKFIPYSSIEGVFGGGGFYDE